MHIVDFESSVLPLSLYRAIPIARHNVDAVQIPVD